MCGTPKKRINDAGSIQYNVCHILGAQSKILLFCTVFSVL